MSTTCLVVFSGLPGAGKTTCVKNIQKTFSSKYNCYLIHYDHFLPIDFENSTFKQNRNNILTATEQFLHALANNASTVQFLGQYFVINANTLPNLLIIDDNMYYRSMRYEFYKLSRNFEISFCQVCIDLELNVILERNKYRSGRENISDSIIQNMYRKFEKPSENWEKYSIICQYQIDLSLISNLIDTSLKSPNCKIDVSKNTKQEQTVLHLIDLALRKIISREIKKVNGEDKAKLSSKLQTWKTECFLKLKNKEIAIDIDNVEKFVENLFICYF